MTENIIITDPTPNAMESQLPECKATQAVHSEADITTTACASTVPPLTIKIKIDKTIALFGEL